jgi:UDP-N-acetylglucosamine pyrophosphorylase
MVLSQTMPLVSVLSHLNHVFCDPKIGIAGINVPRSRFLPVKKTSDLLLVMSNLYSLKNGSLVMSPQRMFPTTPLVKLGDKHFSKVSSI